MRLTPHVRACANARLQARNAAKTAAEVLPDHDTQPEGVGAAEEDEFADMDD
jgi:hypothetical protein